LKYPDLQLVDVGGAKQNLLPPEVCEILPGQAFKGKILDEQTANMILVAAKPPNVNAQTITQSGLRELGFKPGPGLSPALNTFGVQVGTEMAVVPGRILPPPGIRYGKGNPAVDERASWNLRGVQFAVGARLENWGVLLIKDGNHRDEFESLDDPALKQTLQGFAKMCGMSGMRVGNDPPQLAQVALPRKNPTDPTRDQAITTIRGAIMTSFKPKPNIILVILSNGDKHIYSGIKHLCDVWLDVPTVCVQSPKLRKEKGQIQYFANVGLKVNMKLGGVNHSLDDQSLSQLRRKPTMLVGMDVTHPGPGTVKGTPSIAAVVASSDLKYAQYPCSMRIQESKKEVRNALLADRLLLC
jgi:eukaryotic translation initiation factor 2C